MYHYQRDVSKEDLESRSWTYTKKTTAKRKRDLPNVFLVLIPGHVTIQDHVDHVAPRGNLGPCQRISFFKRFGNQEK